MPRITSATRLLLDDFAATVRTSRAVRRWTQERLAREVGISPAHIGRIERSQVPDLSFRLAGRIVDAVGGRIEVRFIGPAAPAARIRDRAHARCVAYAARRFEAAGFLIATEIEVGGERWRAFADLLAMHPRERLLLVIEVKTELHDVGDIDRQLGVAERGAWDAAHLRGWRPRAVTAVLLVLATTENDRRLAENRAYFDSRYRLRSRVLQPTVDGLPSEHGRRERGLAMVDPATRRQAWLLPTAIDGRRSSARYADRAGFLAVKAVGRPRR